jgi:hypothetical protein
VTTRRRARENKTAATTGRSTGLTQEVQDRIVARIRAGVWWITEAVMAEGYTREAHYHWMRQGAKGIEPYASYAAAIEKAKADLEASLLEKMGDLSKCGDAKVELSATQWRLQNLNPARYGRKLEITAPSAPTPPPGPSTRSISGTSSHVSCPASPSCSFERTSTSSPPR